MNNRTIEISVIGIDRSWKIKVKSLQISKHGVYIISSFNNHEYMFPVDKTVMRTTD
jgi:hypothetical protein